ncbi:hypothetical protein Vadar_009915 [Vaccinium darrowii]|uniref:Uncharacterized protein n=1 Tax=Vaccinium darrowii TaxID=229202 RepID=A0ACB7ZAK9_9ERIC|nr:hypothetical protein Vadar_009915 [Vaccinium darrowii]
MVFFSAIFSCFCPSSPSRVSDDSGSQKEKELSSGKGERKSKSSGAPIVMSYFPVNSYASRFCFCPSSLSRVSDDSGSQKEKGPSSGKGERKSKSSGAPIVMLHFPVNSYASCL